LLWLQVEVVDEMRRRSFFRVQEGLYILVAIAICLLILASLDLPADDVTQPCLNPAIIGRHHTTRIPAKMAPTWGPPQLRHIVPAMAEKFHFFAFLF
jgi:hypothetical protein